VYQGRSIVFVWRVWWERLITPSTKIQDPITRQQSQLLAIWLIAGLPLVVFVLVAQIAFGTLRPTAEILSGFFSSICILCLYIVNHQGYYRLAAHATVWMIIIAVGIGELFSDSVENQAFYYLTFAVLVSSILLSTTATTTYIFVCLVAMLVIPTVALHGDGDFGRILRGSLRFVLSMSLVTLAALYYQRQVMGVRQQALEASEAEKSALLNVLPDLMFRFDAHGNYLDVHISNTDDLVENIDFVGKNLCDTVPPEFAQKTIGHITKTLETQHLQIYEYELVVQQGKQQFEARMIPTGKQEVLSIIRNITQRKQAEERLNDVLEEVKTFQRLDYELGYTLNEDQVLSLTMDFALRSANAGVCVVGWIEDGSNQLKRKAIYGESTYLEKPYTVISDPPIEGDRPVHNPLYFHQTYMEKENGIPKNIYLPLLVRGRVRGILALEDLNLKTFSDADEQFLYQLANRAASALSNINNVRHIEANARNTQVLYAAGQSLAASTTHDELMRSTTQTLVKLVESDAAIFCIVDKYNKTARIRHAHGEGLNLRLDEPTLLYALVDLINEQGVVLLHHDALDNTAQLQRIFEYTNLKTVLAFPIWLEKDLAAMLLVGEHQQKRHYSADEMVLMQSFVGQVTVTYQRTNLFHSLQEIEKVKSEMIRMISHDLRNPLAQMIGYMELLEENLEASALLDDELRVEYIHSIQRGSGKMTQLLRDILNLDRLESQEPETWSNFPIYAQVKASYNALLSQAKLKEQTIALDVNDDEQSIAVVGSSHQIDQALTNLIGNAIKYTPEKGTVRVSGQVEGERYWVRVVDTGYGIPKAKQDKIFTRFFRAETPGTEHIGGTGLGLSIVKLIIERHGGAVFFASEEGKGSTFGFWLPLSTSKKIENVTPG